MIYLNGVKFPIEHFPDGSQLLKFNRDKVLFPFGKPYVTDSDNYFQFDIRWVYENDEELVTIYFLTRHIQSTFTKKNPINLSMLYCPNARQDRVKSGEDVFTLKYFAEIINSLNFDNVYVADPHSNVACALFNNLRVVDMSIKLKAWDMKAKEKGQYIYFPDEGAMKRYKDYFSLAKKIYGVKERDWETGKILGLNVHDENGNKVSEDEVKGCSVLMVDDIISYGGTMYYSALKLKELGFKKIYAYATHTENSVLDEEKGTFIKCLNDRIVESLTTTDSIYSGNHPYIQVVKMWPN